MILNALAMVVSAGGAAMLIPAAYSLLEAPEEAWVFWLPSVIALAMGTVLYYPTRRQPRSYVSRQSMFLMVVVCWLDVVLVGALPFMLSGLMGPVDAFFNSLAGFTTTGAATLTPEELSPALLLWRSLSQWIGDRHHRVVRGHRAAGRVRCYPTLYGRGGDPGAGADYPAHSEHRKGAGLRLRRAYA